jgi:hypothetical protein
MSGDITGEMSMAEQKTDWEKLRMITDEDIRSISNFS